MHPQSTTPRLSPEQRLKKAEYLRAYHAAHREEQNQKVRAYRQANREKVLAQKRESYARHASERAAKQRAYYAAHRQQSLEQQRSYYIRTRPARLAQRKAWHRANRARANARSAARYRANRLSELATSHRYYNSHQDECYKRTRRWVLAHPEQVSEYHTRDYLRRKRGLRDGRRCDLTASQWRAIKEAQGHRCARCGQVRPLTRDHIVPISRGGHHTASNIQGLCQSCNSSKGAWHATRYASPDIPHQLLLF